MIVCMLACKLINVFAFVQIGLCATATVNGRRICFTFSDNKWNNKWPTIKAESSCSILSFDCTEIAKGFQLLQVRTYMCCFPFFEMPNVFYWTNSFLPAMTLGLVLSTQSDFRFAVHFCSSLSITLRLNRTSEVLKCCFQTSIWLTTAVSLWLPCTIPSHHWSPGNNTNGHTPRSI